MQQQKHPPVKSWQSKLTSSTCIFSAIRILSRGLTLGLARPLTTVLMVAYFKSALLLDIRLVRMKISSIFLIQTAYLVACLVLPPKALAILDWLTSSELIQRYL